jgi:hypothetical protein
MRLRMDNAGHGLPPFAWDDAALLHAEWLFLAEAGQTAGAERHCIGPRRAEAAAAALEEDAAASLELEGAAAGVTLSVPPQDLSPLTMQTLETIGIRLGGTDNIARLRDSRREAAAFLDWFGDPDNELALTSPLTHAGLTHLWFESIHPYRFGSGIVGRALAEQALMWRQPGMPFVPLSPILLRSQNEYYRILDQACREREATEWLLWFADVAIMAVRGRKAAFSETQ